MNTVPNLSELRTKLPDNIRTRIAPTPSGHLHIGNIFNFLLTHMIVKINGGHLTLRIDNCDGPRARDEYIQEILETIDWLEIQVDHGPSSIDDFHNNFSQLNKIEYYFDQIPRKQTYACNCTRSQIKAASPNDLYPGTCKDKGQSFKRSIHALRLNTDKSDDLNEDFVIWRKADLPAYHLVSVLEDIDNQTNLIIRGNDLFECSEAQAYLANSLDIESTYKSILHYHHKLIRDEDGNKLSKSDGALSIRQLRANGLTHEQLILEFLKFLEVGPSDKLVNFSDLSDYLGPYLSRAVKP